MRMQTVASLKEICHAHANHAASSRAACAILTTWQPVSGNLGLQKCSQYSSKQQWQADRLWAPHTCSRAHFLLSTHCSKEMTWQQSTVTENALNSTISISLLHAAYGCYHQHPSTKHSMRMHLEAVVQSLAQLSSSCKQRHQTNFDNNSWPRLPAYVSAAAADKGQERIVSLHM